MTTRFDLEQEIMHCWNIVEDIELLYHTENLTPDQQQNYLLGIKTIYELKFHKLWTTFEQLTQIKQL